MSNASARNSSFTRSVTATDFANERSKLQAPGALKLFREVIFAGYGPKSEIPSKPVKWLAAGSERSWKSFGFPVAVPPPDAKLVIGDIGAYRGSPPSPAFREFVLSDTVKGVPVRAVKMPEIRYPPSNWRSKPFPLLNHGVSQTGETAMR